ncbi:MAG TPA: protein translocase subunit SecF [Gemmatimonadaceae bacterium]|jgi:preprotein translocase subunit SecF|nr:protein translocase subunit SecF [Gemmatimonadaceae bacterium]
MLRILHDTHYDFIKWWRPSLIIRVLFIGTGLLLLALNGIRWSVEFTGGTVMQVHFTSAPGVDAVRDALATSHVPATQLQQFGSATDYLIRAQEQPDDASGRDPHTRAIIEQRLHERFGDDTHVQVVRAEHIGPTIGAELRRNVAIAMLIAFVLTLTYLAMRFEWRFGLAAVVANMHEVLATFAFISIMRLEFSPTVLAAILTVIGYSLNDTIIIFDRVRENVKRRHRERLYDVVNRAINETLPRSVMTHATVLATALALLLFAGPILRPFAWIMTFGVITATFTSIYVSGGLLLWINHTWPARTDERSTILASVPKPPAPRTQRSAARK